MKRKIKVTYRKVRYIVYKQTILNPIDHIWTFIGSFLGIASIGLMTSYLNKFSYTENIFLIGSFGASAVLIYGATNSPLAQPRNLIGGHLLSALIGVTIAKHISSPDLLWLASALSVSISIVIMQITKTMHPPGGATALIANIGSEKIRNIGYFYVVSPVLSGVLILLIIALLINNIPNDRDYPYKN